MISDVLFEAIEDIERYQREFPKNYDGIKEEIDTVKKAMNDLRGRIDSPPDSLLRELENQE